MIVTTTPLLATSAAVLPLALAALILLAMSLLRLHALRGTCRLGDIWTCTLTCWTIIRMILMDTDFGTNGTKIT